MKGGQKMVQNEALVALVRQLQDGLFCVSEEQAAQMIREARAEALAEAKTILKWLMVQAIVEQATSAREDSRSKNAPVASTPLADEAPPPVIPARQCPVEDEEQIRQEIETIRQKIAENERILGGTKASPAESEATAPSLDDSPGTPAEEDEAGCAYYVYGVVGSDGDRPLAGLPLAGIEPAYPIYPLACLADSAGQGLQAIVSQVPLRDFGPERLEKNLDDMRWLETKARVHQDILDRVAAGQTLIPMRFCTLYHSEAHIQAMLEQHRAAFVQTLARLAGKREWGIKVYCDSQTLAREVGQVSDRLKTLEAEIAAKSSGAAYFMRKKLEETTAEEVEHFCDEAAQHSHERLAGHAAEAIVNPLRAKELTGRPEPMILNGAYLVAEEQLAAFRAEVAALQDEYGSLGLAYELSGPWPSYNFVEERVADE
jgi:hypothetical protein